MSARQRPGFGRQDTDGFVLDNISSPSSSKSSTNKKNLGESPAKEVADVDVKPLDSLEDELPQYDAENDGVAHITEPVETAKDLITQVIHVEDDPSLSPWTFRMFFLGMSSLRWNDQPRRCSFN